jgi:ABC-2 type transport system permease protein
MLGKMAKITRMEFKLTAANRAFIILTILGPFLIVAISVLPSLLSMRGGLGSAEKKIAVVSADMAFVAGITPSLQSAGIKVVNAQADAAALDSMVLAGTLDGYIVLPEDLLSASRFEYVSKNAADFAVTGALQGVIGQSIVAMRLTKAGLPAREIQALVQPPQIDTRKLAASGEKEKSDFLSLLMTGIALVLLLYMTVLLYGQAIGRSVLQEKTSKTVEIMLSSVRPLDLMYGKILGKGAAALVQYAVWVGMTTLFMQIFGPRLGISLSSLSITPVILAYLVLFFLIAFFLYSSLYAALGSAAEDEQHLTQLAWPVLIFLMIPVFLMSPIIMSPGAPLVVGLSLFPLTGPVVMFLRIVAGNAPAGEILLSICIQLVSIALIVYLSAKIFRVGLLMTGKRFKFNEIVKWLRY